MDRFWVPDALIDTRVSQTGKLLYVVICRSSSPRDPWDWTHGQLAEAVGVKERSIRYGLAELKAAGMVTWRRAKTGLRLNVYEPRPPEQWLAAAFKRHVVPVGEFNRQETPAQPATEGGVNRHVVPTPGSTAPGRKAPGSEEAGGTVENSPPSRPSHAQLLYDFDGFWDAIPKMLRFGDAKKLAWEMWRARAPQPEEAQELLLQLYEVDELSWNDIRVFDAPTALAEVCWPALDAGRRVAELVEERLLESILGPGESS
jgi:hypothetical protein